MKGKAEFNQQLMFADGHLLTQLIPFFYFFIIKRCFEILVICIDLDPDPDWSNFVVPDPDTINITPC